MSGLGPVRPPVPVGVTAPVTPLARVTAQFQVHAWEPPYDEKLEVPYLGLAPGMVGIYQADIRMPVTPIQGHSGDIVFLRLYVGYEPGVSASFLFLPYRTPSN